MDVLVLSLVEFEEVKNVSECVMLFGEMLLVVEITFVVGMLLIVEILEVEKKEEICDNE